MIVVSDTTAITNLCNIGRLNILKEVFGSVVIPTAVHQELSEITGQLEQIADLDFIKVIEADNLGTVFRLKQRLDDGEAEAIALALELHADFLVIDEWRGRRVAKELNLPVIGLLGVLMTAKRKGILQKISPILTELINAGFRIHPSIIENALRDAGE